MWTDQQTSSADVFLYISYYCSYSWVELFLLNWGIILIRAEFFPLRSSFSCCFHSDKNKTFFPRFHLYLSLLLLKLVLFSSFYIVNKTKRQTLILTLVESILSQFWLSFFGADECILIAFLIFDVFLISLCPSIFSQLCFLFSQWGNKDKCVE